MKMQLCRLLAIGLSVMLLNRCMQSCASGCVREMCVAWKEESFSVHEGGGEFSPCVLIICVMNVFLSMKDKSCEIHHTPFLMEPQLFIGAGPGRWRRNYLTLGRGWRLAEFITASLQDRSVAKEPSSLKSTFYHTVRPINHCLGKILLRYYHAERELLPEAGTLTFRETGVHQFIQRLALQSLLDAQLGFLNDDDYNNSNQTMQGKSSKTITD